MPFDFSLPVLLALALGLATCGQTASAQAPVGPIESAPTAEMGQQQDVPADALLDEPSDAVRQEALAELAAERVEAARRDSLAREQAAVAAAEAYRLSLPVVYATGYGLQVTLPGGWAGPVTAQEDAFPGYALYTFDNTRPDRAVPGARVRVERIGTLNPVERERWRRGQSPYGLHGLRPVAPGDASSLPGGAQAAVAVGDGELRGLTAYAQRGTTYWTVQVAVPEVVYQADPAVLADLVAGIELPAGLPAPRP